MILEKCEKGHYYDNNKFAKCPYCAQADCFEEEKTGAWSNNFDKTETIVNKYVKHSSDGGQAV